MTSRPRRAAAQRASTAIIDMVDSDTSNTVRPTRNMSSRATSRRSEVKVAPSKLRQATSGRGSLSNRQGSIANREHFEGGEIIEGKRNRVQKKSYVVQSSEDDDDDDDAEADDDDMVDLDEEDAEDAIIVDDTMDLDAEGEDDDDLGEDDAEGEEDDMDVDDTATPVAPTIKVSKPSTTKQISSSKTKTPVKAAPRAEESDDDELSELDSDEDEIQDTVKVGGGNDDIDEDAEGEDEDAEGEDDDELEAAGDANEVDDLGSDEEGLSREGTPDLTKMTRRQRARFEDEEDTSLMKLSDEVQAKKVFTAEELSMRRAEMARRRRNLSEKRNEEVKMETINKLLKKQAPKISRKAQLAEAESAEMNAQRADPVFVRWINTKDGSRVAVPDEMLEGPAGRAFVPGGLGRGKMVEEVS